MVNATYGGRSFRSKLENEVVTSACTLSMLLLFGHLARRKLFWLRALHLPASLLGGVLGWVSFAVVDMVGDDASVLADEWFSVGWNGAPKLSAASSILLRLRFALRPSAFLCLRAQCCRASAPTSSSAASS